MGKGASFQLSSSLAPPGQMGTSLGRGWHHKRLCAFFKHFFFRPKLRFYVSTALCEMGTFRSPRAAEASVVRPWPRSRGGCWGGSQNWVRSSFPPVHEAERAEETPPDIPSAHTLSLSRQMKGSLEFCPLNVSSLL